MLKQSMVLIGGLIAAGVSMAANAASCDGLAGIWKGTFKTDVPSMATCYYDVTTAKISGVGSTYSVHITTKKTKSVGTWSSKCPSKEDFDNSLTCVNGTITTYMKENNNDMVKATLVGSSMSGSGEFHDHTTVKYTIELHK